LADDRSRDLVSLMVKLHCEGFWEKLVIPAFVFFFQMLYPFRAVNDDRSPKAAAAGGCVLLRRAALEHAGGLDVIKGALIDDCALAKAVKSSGGRLWLGLADSSHSLRAASGLDSLWTMVRRTAFTQLRFSYVLLAMTVLGLALVFIAPALIFLTGPWHGHTTAALLAGLAWLLMTLAYKPTVRDYGLPTVYAAALPVTAALYGAMTVDSALAHRKGLGGAWKGRHYDPLATPPNVPKSPV
jgi:hopene-associated glycosyltransferase HpnB